MRRSYARLRSSQSSSASSQTNTIADRGKDTEKMDAFFAKYADTEDPNIIGPEGVERLCRDLQLEPTDIKILLLAWKLRASSMGFFTKEEWRKGMQSMKIDGLEKLKNILPLLQQDITNKHVFKDFYRFSFQYCLIEPGQKTLDLDTGSEMLRLVLKNHPHQILFVQFLKEQTEYKVLNLDQWNAFLRFCDEVKSDFSNYDEELAWPLLMDNFVEWAQKNMQL